jgi:hypothetical protein
MARVDPHFRLRIPAALKAEIEAAAAGSGRSMTAEIIDRLQGAAGLRDLFAGLAMQAILKNYSVDSHSLCAANAYDMAD